MRDYHKWTIPTERSLYNQLKHMSIDEGKTLNELCEPAIKVFKNELVNIINSVLAARQKQEEESRIVAENPMPVSGQYEPPIQTI